MPVLMRFCNQISPGSFIGPGQCISRAGGNYTRSLALEPISVTNTENSFNMLLFASSLFLPDTAITSFLVGSNLEMPVR